MKLLAPAVVTHFRLGGSSPTGWPLEDEVSSGRAKCRCCGQKIAKGELAKTVYVSFNDNYASYTQTKVWMHEKCDHATGEGVYPAELHYNLRKEPRQ